MDNATSVTEKTQPIAVESTEKSKTLTEACSTMKDEIKDKAQEIFVERRDNMGKPQTLTDACSTMKNEIKDEAQRIFPDSDTQKDRAAD